MMSLTPRLRTTSLLLAFALLPLRANADLVQIASGFLTSSGAFMSADFELVGENFDVSGHAEPGVVFPSLTCFPCAAGESIDLRTEYHGTFGSATATVDGTSYPSVRVTGSLVFTAPMVTAPSTAEAFTVTQPFTFESSFVGFLNYDRPDEQMAFEKFLIGQGTVTASFTAMPHPDGLPLFNFNTVRYEFADSPEAPVPEPATLLLFGTGLAAALRYRKAR